MDYYYKHDGEKRGPVGERELRELAERGVVNASTEVWSPDLPAWQPAVEVAALNVSGVDHGTTDVSQPDEPRPTSETAPGGKVKRPWRRYFARMMDSWLLGALWGLFAAFFLSLTAPGLADAYFESSGLVFYAITIAGLIPIEAVLLSSFGTTPGKWLLGLSVESSDGGKPSFEGAIQRTALLWWRGLALGIPIVALFTMIRAKDVLETAGQTTWDRDTGHRVAFAPLAGLQQGAWVLAAAILVFIFF